MGNKMRGLYEKFTVTRTDGGSDPGGKHHGCEYFVLDLMHDKYAAAALEAYMWACKEEYPSLASDLRMIVMKLMASQSVKSVDRCLCGGVGCNYCEPQGKG